MKSFYQKSNIADKNNPINITYDELLHKSDSEIDTWIVIIGALCAAGCAIPGTILVLRRMSLMGDAISHTVLPGIAIAFLVTGSREPTAMLIGAVVIGLQQINSE